MSVLPVLSVMGSRRPLRVVVAPFLLAVAVSGCSRETATLPYASFGGEVMGTTFHVKVGGEGIDAERAAALQEVVAARLGEVDARMSTYREDSELSRFNRAASTEPIPVSPELFEVFRVAREVSEASGGAFDVTVAPAVDAWGFGPAGRGEPPDQATLGSLRERVGFELIELDAAASTLRKTRPEVTADLSAVAKGYGVDRAAEALESEGVEHYMVEVGGEIRTRGRNAEGRRWQLAVERPEAGKRAIEKVFGLSGAALATSGDYRNFYLLPDGSKVSHTIDPRTLRPVEHGVLSASVIHDRCAVADAWATALMVLGAEEGEARARDNGLAVLLLVAEGDGWVERATPAFLDRTGSEE